MTGQSSCGTKVIMKQIMKKVYSVPTALSTSLTVETVLLAFSSFNAEIAHDVGSVELTYDGFDQFDVSDWE